MTRKNLIFIYPKRFTFIETEIKLLHNDFKLISLDQRWNSKWLLPFNLIYQFFFLLFNIFRADCILVSFAGYWSLLPAIFGKLFKKNLFIILHGTDCVKFFDINYGNLRSPITSFFIKHSLKLSKLLLPVSESLMFTKNTYYNEKSIELGVMHHFPDIQTPYKVVPNGLLLDDWNRIPGIERSPDSFVTVMNEKQIQRKGLDLIIEVAKLKPDCSFYCAGLDIKNKTIPKNIFFLGRLSPKELKRLYSRSQFYLQLSNFEGFGVAICEAMLCECIPIVSDVNFLPEIIGDSGFVLEKRNKKLLVELINDALNSDITSLEKNSRSRIVNNFSSDKRREMLNNILLD